MKHHVHIRHWTRSIVGGWLKEYAPKHKSHIRHIGHIPWRRLVERACACKRFYINHFRHLLSGWLKELALSTLLKNMRLYLKKKVTSFGPGGGTKMKTVKLSAGSRATRPSGPPKHALLGSRSRR